MRSAKPSDPVNAEQVRSSYAHLPLTLSISVLNSVLLGFVLASAVSEWKILGWVGLVLLLCALRLALWSAHRRLDIGPSHNPLWTRLAVAGALASGILWGSPAFLFSPLDEAHLLFLALVIAGMCAGAATVHAAHFPSVVAFIVPAILPLAANFFMQGNRLQVVSGIMALVFGASLCIASLKFRTWFSETTAAKVTLARQALEISETNTRLKAEIARHRSTEAKLEHAQKMEAIGRLTAGVAHDFNNLLMAIGGSAGLMSIRLDPDSALLPNLTTILQSVERGATLTRQLLAFGRRQTLSPRSADINQILLGMEELLTATLGGYGSLELRLQREPAIAFVDTTQLENAILNLVINARDAMPNGGSVAIETASLDLPGTDSTTEDLIGSYVRISVSDTGIGMSETVRLRAFDPFFTTKEIGAGSGLGLSQVYGLVQQSGGVTRIESSPGHGTTVAIYLPTAPADTASAAADPTPTAPNVNALHANRRILLLDDDEQVRDTVAEVLRSAGYTVAAFGTAAEALDEINRPDAIDLVVVDFALPDMRGDRFAAKARSKRSAAPVLFITGYADPSALKSEPWVLRKPFTMTSLIDTVEDAMRITA